MAKNKNKYETSCEVGISSLPNLSRAIRKGTIDLNQTCPGGLRIFNDDLIQTENVEKMSENKENLFDHDENDRQIENFVQFISESKSRIKKKMSEELGINDGIKQVKKAFKKKLRKEIAGKSTYLVHGTFIDEDFDKETSNGSQPNLLPRKSIDRIWPHLFIPIKSGEPLFDGIVCNNWIYLKTYPYNPESLNMSKAQSHLLAEKLKSELKKLDEMMLEMKNNIIMLEKNPWVNMLKYYELVEFKAPKLVHDYEQLNRDIKELFKAAAHQKKQKNQMLNFPSEEKILKQLKDLKKELIGHIEDFNL